MNLDVKTLSLNATHPSNNMSEYDLHSLFGHAQGKVTYDIFRESQNQDQQDKLPFVISESTYAGSGQFVSHEFDNYQLSYSNIEQ
jgi:hypothetical protein